ncbi:hypothetical protein ACIOWI_17520 [Streptomyces sp. NPDC087659]|uniref:hypothetical protein n=1 Tax=Streptomyces sp. NPDC087659 TaxID=3365801 RepID=UPI0038170D97
MGPRASFRRFAGIVTTVTAAGLLLCGCGASAARLNGARDAAARFEHALAARDYPAACRLLAPETREQVEEDEAKECAQALAGQDLSGGGTVRRTEVYGRQAMVRAGGQVLFLSQFAPGWRVVAAGCTPDGDRPYRCLVKGG